MIHLLITIFIIYGIFWLIRAYWPRILMWFVKRSLNKQMNDAYKRANSARERQNQPRQHQPRKGKVFGKDVGEYVEFEEVKVYSETTYTETATSRNQRPEPQVTDAEWEDVK